MTSQSTARPLVRADVPRCAVSDLVAFFEGSWQLSRHITDASGRLLAWFSGVGRYDCTDSGLLYGERGVLCSQHGSDVAWRALRYELKHPARAEVFFTNGTAFHDLDLSTGSWKVTHRCGLDRYSGEFSARARGLFEVRWIMSGPTERYVIDTTATRRQAAMATADPDVNVANNNSTQSGSGRTS